MYILISVFVMILVPLRITKEQVSCVTKDSFKIVSSPILSTNQRLSDFDIRLQFDD